MTQDRSPIVDRGEFTKRRGIARVFGNAELSALPTPKAGHEVVLIGSDGEVQRAPSQRSAGERHRSAQGSWHLVDVRPHPWTFSVAFDDADTTAGFVASITVSARVTDAVTVVREGVESVGECLEPAVAEAVLHAAATAEVPPASAQSAESLSETRKRMAAAVRADMEKQVRERVPAWLTASVTSVNVDFDASTKEHYRELVERSRRGALVEADADVAKRRDESEIASRERWKEALRGLVDSPLAGVLEVAAAEPTRENIAAASAQVFELYRTGAQHNRDVLLELINNNYLDETDPLYVALKGALQGNVTGALGLPMAMGGQNGGDAPAQLKQAEDAETVDAEAHTQVGEWEKG